MAILRSPTGTDRWSKIIATSASCSNSRHFTAPQVAALFRTPEEKLYALCPNKVDHQLMATTLSKPSRFP